MNRPNFLHGVALAIALALLGALGFSTLSLVFSVKSLTVSMIVLLGGTYVVYLLVMSEVRIGRVSVAAIWLLASATLLWFTSDLSVLLGAQLFLIWLVRCCYFHERSLAVVLDLGVCCVAGAAMVVTAWHTRSVFMTVWVFFLCQASFTFIPRPGAKPASGSSPQQRFEHALRAAENAVRRLHLNP